MLILRLILVFALLIGATILAFRAPWMATAELHGLTYKIRVEDAPIFRPPPKPGVDRFKGKLSPYLDPRSVEIRVLLDKLRYFSRFAGLIVGSFFLFGLAGLFRDRRPVGPDVAYSLGLTSGFLLSSLLCLLLAQILKRDDATSWFPYFWAGGVAVALLITASMRRHIPARR
jgi:hypothetical protein